MKTPELSNPLLPSEIYQALVIRTALRAYAQYGIKVNTKYTPKNMMGFAERRLGKKFKARDYLGAAQALENWAKQRNVAIKTEAAILESDPYGIHQERSRNP